jgi:tRNA pseudouridine55 synthase
MYISNNQLFTRESDFSNLDFEEGAVLLIDKPKDWTSFDVVNKIRFKLKHGLQVKKIKVGHAGTLDPLATGLLLICTGKLTKSIDLLQAKDKIYSGSIFLGATTPTYDAESTPDATFEIDHIDISLISKKSKEFLGNIEQVPPIYSAIKIKGSKAYDLARRGKSVEMPSRPVTIHSFEILDHQLPILTFEVKCSKGTYIRSLAYDFGKALNSGAYLHSLRRESIGEFNVKAALGLPEALSILDKLFS